VPTTVVGVEVSTAVAAGVQVGGGGEAVDVDAIAVVVDALVAIDALVVVEAPVVVEELPGPVEVTDESFVADESGDDTDAVELSLRLDSEPEVAPPEVELGRLSDRLGRTPLERSDLSLLAPRPGVSEPDSPELSRPESPRTPPSENAPLDEAPHAATTRTSKTTIDPDARMTFSISGGDARPAPRRQPTRGDGGLGPWRRPTGHTR